MSDRENLYRGLSLGAWGYFFLNFDFNLGAVSVLPRFVGFLLLLSAIHKLSGARRDLALLRPLCVLLAVWALVDWCLSWAGGDLDGQIIFLDLLTTAAALYFHFQFLTDMAALAEGFQPENDNLPSRIRSHRTAFTLLVTAIGLLSSLSQAVPWAWWDGVTVFVAVITCIVALMIMADLFRLRGRVREDGPARDLAP